MLASVEIAVSICELDLRLAVNTSSSRIFELKLIEVDVPRARAGLLDVR